MSQNEEIQEQIAELLTALVRLRHTPPGNTEPARMDDSLPPSLRKRLGETQDIHFEGGTLHDLIAWLRGRGIPAELDEKGLAEANLTELKLRPLDAHNVSLRWAFGRILSDEQLTFLIDHDAVLITASVGDQSPISFLYPVGDLIDAAAESSGADTATAFDELMKTIRTTVAPQSWDNVGGPGGLTPITSARVLICDQMFETQPEIEKLLSELRAAYKAARSTSAAYSPVKPQAMLKFYQLSPTAEKAGKVANLVPAEQYAAVIRSIVEPKSWTDGSGSICISPGGLIVCATPAVQTRVQRLLEHVGVLPAAPRVSNPPGPLGPTTAASAFAVPTGGTPAPLGPAPATPAPATNPPDGNLKPK